MSGNSRKEFIRTDNAGEIELQMSTLLKSKYYGHHSMSRKFKYRWEYQNFGNFTDMRIYHNIFITIKAFDKLEKHAFFMTSFIIDI